MIPSDEMTRILRNIAAGFIQSPQVQKALRRLDEMMVDRGGAEPQHLLLIGEPGTGKSTLIHHFTKRHPRIEHSEYTQIPLVTSEVPSTTTPRGLAGVLLHRMGSPFWDRGDQTQRTIQLATLLAGCKTQLLILDEANHLVDRGGSKSHHALADWIKQLGCRAGPAVALAGTPRAEMLLAANDQLRSRFGEVMSLEPYSTVTTSKLAEFCVVMRGFRKLLGDVPCIDLSAPENVRQLAFATGGRLRCVRDLLQRAVQLAAREESPRIDYPILARSFAEVIYRAAPAGRNPFLADFNGVPLTNQGEPYGPEVHDGKRRKTR